MEKSLSNQEINEAVARKLGWTLCEDDPLPDVKEWHSPGNGPGICTSALPDYCNKIEAAWEIMEKLEKASINRIVQLTYGNYDKKWFCGVRGDIAADIWQVWEGSDTAPMAICKAFLKLEEKE